MPTPKTRRVQTKRGGGPTYDGGKSGKVGIAKSIRVQQLLGDVKDLVLTAESPSQLRRILNSAAWKIKKAGLVEALEMHDIGTANRLASEILTLTEVKKARVESNINIIA